MRTYEPGDAADRPIIDILRARDGVWTDVELKDGRVLKVLNIAWGYDEGDQYAHVTANVSPRPSEETSIDLFFTHEVRRMVDPQNGIPIYNQ